MREPTRLVMVCLPCVCTGDDRDFDGRVWKL